MKCPNCGGDLENGYIHAPRGIYWSSEEHALIAVSSEAILSMWSLTMPRVHAARCTKCGIVLFAYSKETRADRGISVDRFR